MLVHCIIFDQHICSIFNSSIGGITEHSRSVKDMDPYFKSYLYVEDSGHQKPVLILPNELSKSGEQVQDRN